MGALLFRERGGPVEGKPCPAGVLVARWSATVPPCRPGPSAARDRVLSPDGRYSTRPLNPLASGFSARAPLARRTVYPRASIRTGRVVAWTVPPRTRGIGREAA